MPRIYNIFKIM